MGKPVEKAPGILGGSCSPGKQGDQAPAPGFLWCLFPYPASGSPSTPCGAQAGAWTGPGCWGQAAWEEMQAEARLEAQLPPRCRLHQPRPRLSQGPRCICLQPGASPPEE